jgi:L-fucose isomerase-like protein
MDIQEAIHYTTTYLSRAYPLVDPEDIEQELWVWAFAHSAKLNEWRDDELGEAKLKKSLRNAGIDYAKPEQEARSTVTGTAGDGNGVPLWVEIPEDLD